MSVIKHAEFVKSIAYHNVELLLVNLFRHSYSTSHCIRFHFWAPSVCPVEKIGEGNGHTLFLLSPGARNTTYTTVQIIFKISLWVRGRVSLVHAPGRRYR